MPATFGPFESATLRRRIALLAAALVTVALVAADTAVASEQSRSSSASQCRKATEARPSRRIPQELRGSDVVGEGILWTGRLRSENIGYVPRPDDPSSGDWAVKTPWYRLKAGDLAVTGKRLDGAGTFFADLAPAESYPTTGPLPSNLHFSDGGCWRVEGRLRTSRVVLYVSIDDSRRAICEQLVGQRANIREINNPANESTARLVEAALHAHDCSVPSS